MFNSYEKDYLNKMNENQMLAKRNLVTKAEMIKFYTGGPDENILSTFEA